MQRTTTRIILGLIIFVATQPAIAQQKYAVKGRITDEKGEPLIGANIIIKELTRGTVTDGNGTFNLALAKGEYNLNISYVGYAGHNIKLKLDGDKSVNIKLKEDSKSIESVEVYAEAPNHNISRMEMSTNKLEMKQVQKLPVVFGEGDIIKTLQLLPGVISAGEASGGFHVRGGNVDQNLILIDNAQVYNASHSVGFFSVFNSNAIDDIKLYKGGIPSEFGGRLSSVLDIKTVDGNMTGLAGEASVGVISSKLKLEGPLVPNRVSMYVSGRRTYADLFLPFAKDSMARESSIFFYDLNSKIKIIAGKNDRINLSAYYGRDAMLLGSIVGQKYGNEAYTAHWNHFFNPSIFLNTFITSSVYDYEMKFSEDSSHVKIHTSIFDLSLKSILTYKINADNELRAGIEVTRHDFNPGHLKGHQAEADFNYKLPNTLSFEYGFFVQNQHSVTPRLSFIYGLRYSVFHNIGKGESFTYDKTNPDDYIARDTSFFGKGEIYNFFPKGIEPRLSMRYMINESSSLKAGYNRIYQYIQLASNSTSSLPLEYWFPSSPNIKPQFADQIAAGYFKNLADNTFELSLETFYKDIKNTIDFKDHANLILNKQYEGQVRSGRAWAYGAEFMVRKQKGNFTGWVSYTYSRVFKQIKEINNGVAYPASYDKPHDIAVVLSYDINKRLNLSGTWVYTSAPPRTMPVKKWEYAGMTGPSYGQRNSMRVFPYHRMDLAATIRLNKIERQWEHSLNISVYNAYANHNYIMVSFSEDPENRGKTIVEGTYLYTFVPSVSYQIRF
ncbi:MAG: TonB-dependent receptor [Bacteroidales bacterium]|nr:TonB-dependent receptor [Bacteroidales bacterium]